MSIPIEYSEAQMKDSVAFYYAAAWALEYVTMDDDTWQHFRAVVEARRRQPFDEPWQMHNEFQQMAMAARASAVSYYNTLLGYVPNAWNNGRLRDYVAGAHFDDTMEGDTPPQES